MAPLPTALLAAAAVASALLPACRVDAATLVTLVSWEPDVTWPPPDVWQVAGGEANDDYCSAGLAMIATAGPRSVLLKSVDWRAILRAYGYDTLLSVTVSVTWHHAPRWSTPDAASLPQLSFGSAGAEDSPLLRLPGDVTSAEVSQVTLRSLPNPVSLLVHQPVYRQDAQSDDPYDTWCFQSLRIAALAEYTGDGDDTEDTGGGGGGGGASRSSLLHLTPPGGIVVVGVLLVVGAAALVVRQWRMAPTLLPDEPDVSRDGVAPLKPRRVAVERAPVAAMRHPPPPRLQSSARHHRRREPATLDRSARRAKHQTKQRSPTRRHHAAARTPRPRPPANVAHVIAVRDIAAAPLPDACNGVTSSHAPYLPSERYSV